MGNLSEIGDIVRQTVRIPVLPHLRDHVFAGKAVFPAVASMALLAKAVHGTGDYYYDGTRLFQAAFEKFLAVEIGAESIEAVIEMECVRGGGVQASLVTRQHLGASGITRVKGHARALFFPAPDRPDVLRPPESTGLETEMVVPPDRVYRELVPFGPAYRNISGPVKLCPKGVSAEIRAPVLPGAETLADGPLGSPFVLDAAFHAACVWGQRYTGFTGFPVGFEKRVVEQPTTPGTEYVAHAFPAGQMRGENVFDLWICGPGMDVFEFVKGLRMRDVYGGPANKPPVRPVF